MERLVNAGENIATWRALLAVIYMALGREAEAKAEITRAMELFLDLSITEVLTLIPMRDSEVSEVSERYAQFLSEAGLSD